MDKIRLAQNIKNARCRAKLSQKALAELLELKCSEISKWETGNRTPKLESIEKIAKACGVIVANLLRGVIDD